MRQLLKTNRYFLIPHFFALLICAILLLVFTKTELHIFSNQINSLFADIFFKYATHIGDGAMIAVLGVILIFIKYRYTIAFVIGSLLTSGIINFLKRGVFNEVYRPSKYFELYETYQLHFVEGVNLHAKYSFPSGHTGTAFNLFFMLALIIPNKSIKLVLFLMAALVGYSRVYLSQHFLIDITVGSVLGTTIMLLLFWWISKSKQIWLDKSLIRKK